MAKLIDLIVSGKSSFANDINAKNIYADKFATTGGTTAHVVRGDGSLQTIASLSVGNADTVDGQHFNWNNNKNDHTYLWAASANGQAYLVHRASMSVNYANSAGSATKDSAGNTISSYYLPLSGGTMTGPIRSDSGYVILNPIGASYHTTTSSVSGCITINLPASVGNTMVSMWIDVYIYESQKSFSVHCGGYTYNNSTWANSPFAIVYGANHRVRLGHNGTQFVIYIGETNTTWSYPQVSVRNVTLGYTPTLANWAKAWSVSFSTSVSNVTYDTTTYAWTTKNLAKSEFAPASHKHTKLHRRDDASDYSVQHHWTGSYWYLRGYSGDTFHAEVQVGYANNAGNADTVDSLHASAFMRATSDGSFYGIQHPGGGTSDWTRTTTNGIIPVKSGGASSLGTSSWPFSTVYANNFYGYLNGNISGSSASVRDAGNGTAITFSYSTGGFTTNPTWLAAWNGYNVTYVSPSVVSVGHASTVTVNDSNANSTYRMVWHSGNTLYSTGGIYCNPSTDYLYATSMNASDWFRSSGNTGWYNPTNSCHVYPNNLSTYGGLILRGTKGGYHGFLLGESSSYMNLMDDGTNKGLYQESNGQWIVYYHRTNKRIGLLTSSLKSYPITLSGDTYIVGGWLRTEGDTGWYNESYGGGWYMSDTTYIRVYGSKRVYNANTSQYAFYTSGGMTALGHMYSSSSACSWIAGQNATNAALNIADATDTGSYWPWFRQTNTASSKWFSVGTLGNRLYFIGSATSRTANSYDYGFSMDFSNGYLYGNFSGYLSGTASNVTVNDSNSDSTYRMVWHSGNTLYSTAGIYCNPSTDAMYATRYYANGSSGPHFTGTSAAGNWAYLRLNNSAHIWDIATRSDSGSGGLWLSRYAGGDNGIFVTAASTPKVGINTSSPSETLTVAGWVGTTGATGWYNITYAGGIHMSDATWVRIYNNKKFYVNNSDYNAIHSAGGVYVAGMVHSYANYLKSTNSGKYLMIGPQNGSHAHYETDATTSHWFNKRVDVNGAIWRYGTNYGISSDGYFYAKGVYANRDGSSTGGGVSLYADSDPMTYGIAFRGTGTYGTKGRVQSDWATYLTMSDTTNRGWIFRRGSTNVASVSGEGIAYFEGVGRDTYIAYPGGATYTYGSGNITGALKITLPVKGCNTMMHMKITIYNYSGETSATYHVAGYNYYDGNWHNCTAYSLRQGTNGYGNLTVRFGNDGSKDCIYIGETSTTWSYPNVVVSDVLIGHSSQSHASWSGGWSITVTTSLGNIKTTISNPAINNYVRIQDSNANSTYRMIWHSGNELYSTDGIYCNPSSDYLYASSVQTSDWFRSTGKTGWYSQTYGGGWYMTDTSWIRSYGGHGVIAGGFYHSSYGSSTYLLRSDGGVSAFTWSGQSGQPTWVWGGNSQHSYYVYNPSNFSVYKANKADQLEAYTGSGFTGGDHFVRAIRYDSWHTRLYMGYYRDTTLQNTIHVGYADNATNADTLDSYHSNRFVFVYNSANYNGSSGLTLNDIAADGNSNSHVGMIYAGTDNPVSTSGNWLHVWSQSWTRGSISSWCSQIALGVQQGTGMWYRTTSGALAGRGWYRVIDSGNIGSQSVNYASSVGINYNNNSNSTYQMLWGSGNYVYGTSGIYCNPYYDILYAEHHHGISHASSWIDGQKNDNAAFLVSNATDTGSYWPWIRQTNTGSGKWHSIGVLANSLYFLGSTTSRTANGYDYCFRMDFSNGYLYGNFSGYLSGTAAYATYIDSTSFSAGSATNPVYFTGGRPSGCTYSLNATVKSGDTGRFAYYPNTRSVTSYGSTVGSAKDKPMYLNSGVPTTMTYGFFGSTANPVIIWVGYIDRSYSSSTGWSARKSGGMATVSCTSHTSGRVTITLTNAYALAAFCSTREIYNGGYKHADDTTEQTGRSAGMGDFWVYCSGSTVHVRKFKQQNGNNDKWTAADLNTTTTADGNKPVTSFYIAIIGYYTGT